MSDTRFCDRVTCLIQSHTALFGSFVLKISWLEDVVSLHAISRFKIAQSFPVGQEASFESISNRTGLNIIDLKRVLRHAMTNHIFCEPRADFAAHTAASKVLAENALVGDFVGMTCEEKFKGSACVRRVRKKKAVLSKLRADGREVLKTVDALVKRNGAKILVNR